MEMKTIKIFAIVFALIILIFVSVLAQNNTMSEYEWEPNSYIVSRGDTLWGLSRKHCPEDVDKTEWIEAVKKINKMENSMIIEGEKIIILVAGGKR